MLGTKRPVSAYRILLILALVACAVAGRWTGRQPASLLDADGAFRVAGQTETFAHIIASGAERPMMMIDEENGRFFELMVGENHDTHAVRLATLRVDRRSGEVYRLDYDQSGEFIWLPESLVGPAWMPRRTS
jgi:hypothetical protein